MTDANDWESVSRETLHWALMCLLEDASAVVAGGSNDWR